MTSLTKYLANNLTRDIPSFFGDWEIIDDFFPVSTRNYFRNLQSQRVDIDIKEYEDKLEVVADVPGFDKKDINIKLEKGILTVSGEIKNEKKEEDVKYLHREITSKKFSRSFRLGDNIDEEKIDASYKNGLLTITLPKTEEKELFKQIEVK